MPPSPKILVISITRMGDIIQSIPFFRRLRRRNPGAEIHVLVERCFADVAAFLPEVDRLHTIQLEDLLPDLASGRNGDLSGATAFYRDFIGQFRAANYSEVWNLTHTRPSTILNYLLAAENGRGVTLDSLGLQRVNSPWLIYFFATNLARPWCQFNLVDIYANCIDQVEWLSGRSLSIPDQNKNTDISHLRLSPSARWRIAVHPGASQSSKQWPVEQYRAVVQQLSRRHNVEIVVVGGKRDRNLGNVFAGMPRVVNAIGETTVPQLTALLSQTHLLLSNDSGPMHIAAAVGTRVLDITVGSALGHETAPYGEGHVVLEPDIDCFPCSPFASCSTGLCSAKIQPDTVAVLVGWMLGWQPAPLESELRGSRVYQTGFSGTDGMLDLAQIFHSAPCGRDELHKFIRPVWLSVLENQPSRSLTSDVRIPREVSRRAAAALTLARQAKGFAAQLARAAHNPSEFLPTIKNLGELLSLAEADLSSSLRHHGLLRSFDVYSGIARASLAADDLVRQAEETADIYDRMIQLLRPLAEVVSPGISQTKYIPSLVEESYENLTEWA
ncbi:glycosyltransferase family 9 protein [candidate division KSB1 bacterium]|nr:MAG: glycosyltransferase family 9 protein [candidate division KSB1 bacterium]